MKVAVIGLGYIGATNACVSAYRHAYRQPTSTPPRSARSVPGSSEDAAALTAVSRRFTFPEGP